MYKTVAFLLITLAWMVPSFPAHGQVERAACQPAPLLAQSLLDDVSAGQIDFQSRLGIDVEALTAEGRVVATVETSLDRRALQQVGSLDGAPTTLCLSIVIDTGDDLLAEHQQVFTVGGINGAQRFRYGVTLPLPDETAQVFALIEVPERGLWGGAPVEQTEDLIPPPGDRAVRIDGPQPAWYEATVSAVRTKRDAESATVLRLVPPRKQPATGSTRIYALISTPSVKKVSFFLDGEPIAEKGREPYYAAVPLAKPARAQDIRAIAYDRNGNKVGEDTLRVNERDAPFRVRISSLEGQPTTGSVEVTAEVGVPLGAQLTAVELFYNERKIKTFDEGPYRARVPTPGVRPTDFIRVAATLDDGRTIDDVVLLASPGLAEKVDVNLVAVYAVVTDEDGNPVADLTRDAFDLTRGGRTVEVQDFSYAQDVPLLLGLVIDTSNSMSLVMNDTKRAAIQFVQEAIREDDQGFLVDFDFQPRLLHDTTSDVVSLLGKLGTLRAEGSTSLYDAIVFSMVQFERQGGRKALVVLTDGADHDSKFGPKDCIEFGVRLGVPIYILALDNHWGTKFPKRELRRIVGETGGDLLFVDGIESLPETYARINAELRSQYFLTFYTDEDLTDAERRAVQVEVDRPGTDVRRVIGTGPGG